MKEKFDDFIKNKICPLRGSFFYPRAYNETPPFPISQCDQIIFKARKLWGINNRFLSPTPIYNLNQPRIIFKSGYSHTKGLPENTLKAARNIVKNYPKINQLSDKFFEDCGWVYLGLAGRKEDIIKQLRESEKIDLIKEVTDAQIIAILAICKAVEVLWHLNSDIDKRDDEDIKKILDDAASLLNEAEQIANEKTDQLANYAKQNLLKGNVFRKIGNIWNLVYREKHIQIKDDYKGLDYIQTLIRHQYKPIYVINLEQILAREDNKLLIAKEKRLEFDDQRSTTQNGQNAILDKASIEEYNKAKQILLQKYDDAKVEGDTEKMSEYQDEIDSIEEQLKTNIKINGKPREFSDDKTKTYKRIQRDIKRSIDIFKTKHYALYKHFQKPNLITGTHCLYNPTEDPHWQLD